MTDELFKVAEDSARGSFFLMFGTAIATVIMAIASIIIARFLGPELYGQYTLVLIVPELLFLFTDLGINQGIIKFTASLRVKGETSRLTKIIKYGLLLKASTGIAIFIINYVVADLFASALLQRPDLALYIRIASITIVFQVIFTTATSAFVGLDKTEYNALTSNIQAIAKAIISIALVLVGFSIAGALMGHVASYIVAAGASASMLFFILRQKQNAQNSHSLADDLKTLIHYGTPLYISLLLTGFITLYQNFILAIFTTDAEIGNYKAAINFTTLITVFTIPITTALLPAFSKLDASTTQKIRTFFKLANKYTAILILPITVLIIIFSNEVVQLIYGPTFESAPLFLATYSLLYLLIGLGYLTLTSFYNGLGETKTTLKMNLITFLTVTVLSPIFTKTYGVLGLIVAFLIASIASTSYGSYIARTNHRIEFDTKSMVKIYLVSIFSTPPLLILLLQPWPLPRLFEVVAGALLYLFTYVTLTPLAKIMNHSELQSATLVLQKIKALAAITAPLLEYQKKILNYKQRPKHFI